MADDHEKNKSVLPAEKRKQTGASIMTETKQSGIVGATNTSTSALNAASKIMNEPETTEQGSRDSATDGGDKGTGSIDKEKVATAESKSNTSKTIVDQTTEKKKSVSKNASSHEPVRRKTTYARRMSRYPSKTDVNAEDFELKELRTPYSQNSLASLVQHIRRLTMSTRRGTSFVSLTSIKKKTSEEDENAEKKLKECENLDSSNLEEEMALAEMRRLEEIFAEADEDGGGGLDMEEFRFAMRISMGDELTDSAADKIFMKVDTNCDGTVDWDEYLTYMCMELIEKNAMDSLRRLPFPTKVYKVIHKMHLYQKPSDTTVRCMWVPNFKKSQKDNTLYKISDPTKGNYWTVSQTGSLNFWDKKLQHQCRFVIPCNKQLTKGRTILITDAIFMENANLICVATSFSDVLFYTLVAGNVSCLFEITNFELMVTCFYYWYDKVNLKSSVLVAGTARGDVYIIDIEPDVFVPYCYKADKNSKKISELTGKTFHGLKTVMKKDIHIDFVKQVHFSKELGCFFSCSEHDKTSLYCGNVNTDEGTYYLARKGVSCFDVLSEQNLLVTGSRDNGLRVWNLYMSSKPAMMLTGHCSPINAVIIDKINATIISIDRTKDIFVWSIGSQMCMQHISSRKVTVGKRALITSTLYNPHFDALLLAGTKLALFQYEDAEKDSTLVKTHSKAVTCVLYNELFEQVVTAATDSLVCVWEITTGRKHIQFTAHKTVGKSGIEYTVDITAMSFDETHRKLLTGARNGEIKVWNFNNGVLLHQLEIQDRTEVTAIICARSRIFITGWSQRITSYLCDPEEDYVNRWKKVHKHDIMTMAFIEPNCLATGSFDGDIILWNVESGYVSLRMNGNRSYKPVQSYATMEGAKQIKNTDKFWFALMSKVHKNAEERAAKQLAEEEASEDYKLGHSVYSIIFLKARISAPKVATLVVSYAGGWIQCWSRLHNGEMITQFNAAHRPEESILTMVTDPDNLYLITGDTDGYIKVWDLSAYAYDAKTKEQCIEKMIKKAKAFQRYKRFNFLKMKPFFQTEVSNQDKHRKPPERTHPRKTHVVPKLLNSFRGHLCPITAIDFVPEKDFIITGSSDCSVRVWTICGTFIGALGHKASWKDTDLLAADSSDYLTFEQRLQKWNAEQMAPTDIRETGSANTLRLLAGIGQRNKWKLARHLILKGIGGFTKGERFTHPEGEGDEKSDTVEDTLSPLSRPTSPLGKPKSPSPLKPKLTKKLTKPVMHIEKVDSDEELLASFGVPSRDTTPPLFPPIKSMLGPSRSSEKVKRAESIKLPRIEGVPPLPAEQPKWVADAPSTQVVGDLPINAYLKKGYEFSSQVLGNAYRPKDTRRLPPVTKLQLQGSQYACYNTIPIYNLHTEAEIYIPDSLIILMEARKRREKQKRKERELLLKAESSRWTKGITRFHQCMMFLPKKKKRHSSVPSSPGGSRRNSSLGRQSSASSSLYGKRLSAARSGSIPHKNRSIITRSDGSNPNSKSVSMLGGLTTPAISYPKRPSSSPSTPPSIGYDSESSPSQQTLTPSPDPMTMS